MEFCGALTGLSRDWNTDQVQISFTVEDETVLREIEQLKNSKLSIKVKKWRKKRSLDSNAYCWVLMTKIAEVIGSSKDEVYEEMLRKYGYLYNDDDGYIVMTIRSHIDISKVQGHWKAYKNNGKFTSYLMIKGSSEYDTKEMSHFVEQIVLEAQELGIQTLTPDEIAKMNALWGVKNG